MKFVKNVLGMSREFVHFQRAVIILATVAMMERRMKQVLCEVVEAEDRRHLSKQNDLYTFGSPDTPHVVMAS